MATLWVWCASLGYVNIRGRRVFIPLEAHGGVWQEACGNHDVNEHVQPNAVYGLMELQGPHGFDVMQVYDEATEVQFRFWQAILSHSTTSSAAASYVFRVSSAVCLPQPDLPTPLLQCSNRKLRGFVVELESGQSERLWTKLPRQVQLACPSVPAVALRTAPQHAHLLCTGAWKTVCLPHQPHPEGLRGGSHSVHIHWSKLGLQQPPPAPGYCLDIPEGRREGLDKARAWEVANALRKLFTQTVFGDDDVAQLERVKLIDLTHTMMDMSEQLDPLFLQKTVRQLQGRATIHGLDDSARRKLKFNVIWLIEVMMMSNCLRDSADLNAVLAQAVHMLLPPVIRSVILGSLRDAASRMPHKSTISRWRCLLDGGFMVWHRQQQQLAAEEGRQHLRWMMSDSSTQHGRSFQLTALLSLSTASAGQALRMANELANVWFRPWLPRTCFVLFKAD